MKKTVFQKKFFVIFALILTSFLAFQDAKAGSWKIETVDSKEVVGRNSSLAVDSNNKTHIAYYDSTNKYLKYITNSSGSWKTKSIENMGEDPGSGGISIAVDADDTPHICYRISADKVRYAVKVSGAWTAEEIDTGHEGCSIAFDSNDNLYIAYQGGADLRLKLAARPSGSSSWATDEINSDEVGDVSLAIDSNNKLHIVYQDQINEYLKYTTNKSGVWSTAEVINADSGMKKLLPSIAFDFENKVHITYTSFTASQNEFKIKYATNLSGSWAREEIGAGAISSIAINNNKVYIAYYGPRLKYANKNSGSWQSEIIDSNGDTGSFASLKINSSGKAFISYFDGPNGDLKYATNVPVVQASIDSGIYSKAQKISLSSDYTATIYYTLDSSIPTTSFVQYTSSIKINKPTSLRFFARDSSNDQSEVQAKQYIITPTPFLYQANAIINYQNGKVKIYNNKRKYTGKSFYPFGKNYKGPAVFLTIGDPNNNQDGELVASTRSQIKILTKSGKTKYKIKTPSYRIKAADINMDGKEEILVGWKNKLKIYSGRKKIASLELNRWIKDFAAARLSNRKKPNLVIATWDDKLAIYNYRNKKFKLKKTKNYSLITLQAIDINNSGLDRLVVRKNNQIKIVNSNFKTLYTIKKTGILTVADLNKDNKLEVVLNSFGNHFLSYQKSGKTFKKIKDYKLKGFNFGGRF
ncbi:MAG: chitobiase/beta-hexosaminidase C-terminal domain-containing protein [Patescibacteria group bacterium]